MQTHNSATHEAVKVSSLEERATFFFVAMGIIALTYGLFVVIDFLPEKPGSDNSVATEVGTTDTTAAESEEEVVSVAIDPLPVTIIFDTLNHKEITVLNPESSDITVLNEAIRHGVARHPDSATFDDVGTIFLFGHSTYLPNIMNKNLMAFNDIQKLVWGDTIRLQSGDTEYLYSVERVYEAKATEASVSIERGSARLVLSTCNTFGTKDDRFIVEASLVKSRPLTNS